MRVEHQTQAKISDGAKTGYEEPWESLGNSRSRTRSPIVIGDLLGFPDGGKGRT